MTNYKKTIQLFRNKVSALLMDTDEENHLNVYIPLELQENQGLSTNDMLTVEEIWQHPIEGIIMVKIKGVVEPQEIEEYEECIPQIYEYLAELLRKNVVSGGDIEN